MPGIITSGGQTDQELQWAGHPPVCIFELCRKVLEAV